MTTLTATMRRLLALIAQHGPITLATLQREEGDIVAPRSLRERVNDLRGSGLVRGYKVRRGAVMMVEATDDGRIALAMPEPQPEAPVIRTIAQPRDAFRKDHYDGRELRPYTGRPGAMRAFDLPSIQNGRVTERRPPFIMGCTPQLKGGPK
jgi:hypothetical protein